MRYPFNKYVLGTRFGIKGKNWKCGYHSGLDLKSKNYGGDGKVYPLYEGTVRKITHAGSYGNCIYIQHPDGYLTLYAHLKKINVVLDQHVTEHTCLGIEGTTGNSTGLHLHIEVHKDAYHYPATIDPLKFIGERRLEVVKLNILINGELHIVEAIEKDGHNYIKLQDLRTDDIEIGYDKVPVINTITRK